MTREARVREIDPNGIDRDLRKQVSSLLAVAHDPLTFIDDIPVGLGTRASQELRALVEHLLRDVRFEHLSREEISSALFDAAMRYRNTTAVSTSSIRDASVEVLNSMAAEPLSCTVYLGIGHIGLAHRTVVGAATFLRLSEEPELKKAFERGPSCPELVCAVEVTAGTDELLLERAREQAEIALAIVRQRFLFGFAAKIYLDQVLFGLDGTYARSCDGALTGRGWWRRTSPMPENLSGLEEWNESLRQLSDLYLGLNPDVRSRADVCISWLDVAALTENWRIIIPTVFSALESLLVPDNFGSKGAAISVRSIAVKIATGHDIDFVQAADAYWLRNQLVHGNTTEKMLTAETLRFADSLRRWAFGVLADYLELAAARRSESAKSLIKHLGSECRHACVLLRRCGQEKVANQYEGKKDNRLQTWSTTVALRRAPQNSSPVWARNSSTRTAHRLKGDSDGCP